MNIIICNDNLPERTLMIDYILKWASAKCLEMQIGTCKNWAELAAALEGREWDLVIVALDGVRGLDTAASAQLLSRRLIWISDLDFGVQAYRMCVSYFFMKPVSCQKMQRALECALKGQGTT